MLRDAQVKKLRNELAKEKTLSAVCAALGFTDKTGRKWQWGPMPSQRKKERTWRTRPDPFEGIWQSDIVPLLQADRERELTAVVLLENLSGKYGEAFGPSQLRTLQRRISEWRVQHGPEKEVYFEQVKVPGREGAFDFTCCDELQVTIAGQVLLHKLFQFILTFSGWRSVSFALSETFQAMQEGIENALHAIGGVPPFWRSDNLSAATRALSAGNRELTERYGVLLSHYGAQSSRIQPGEPHENGCAERAHRTLKKRLKQALILRGSRDFATLDDYKAFVAKVVETLNAPKANKWEQERAMLQPLPTERLVLCDHLHARVRKWSVIQIRGKTYSVPSRLIGCTVDVRVYAERIEVWYKGQKQLQMQAIEGTGTHRIHYRHVIDSLVRKPGAFARYRYREEMFPSVTFRRAYDRLQKEHPTRADKDYLRILWLAAHTSESKVESALETLLKATKPFDCRQLRHLCNPEPTSPSPLLLLPATVPDLTSYDALLRAS